MKPLCGSRISQKILYRVVSCLPFCKPSPIIVEDSCNAPVCAEITTKLCIRVVVKTLDLLGVELCLSSKE